MFRGKEEYSFFPFAIKALRKLTHNPYICSILWTCSKEDKIKEYLVKFKEKGIDFKYVNKNPECPTDDLANFDSKFYMNVGLDDKFGFNPNIEWFFIYLYLKIKKKYF